MVSSSSSSAAAFLFMIFLALPSLSSQSPVSTPKKAFRFGLIHRDSPLSPLFDPDATASDRWKAASDRSMLRYESIESALYGTTPQQGLNTSLLPARGEYVMNISFGTPPVTVMAIMDTGSELSWIQCLPCTECYPQMLPIFDPSKSSSHEKLACDEPECKELFRPSCSGYDCHYEVRYIDRSYTRGTLSSDTLTMITTEGNAESFRGIVFGCGHENHGTTFRWESGGLVGLTDRPLSLLNQLASYGVAKMFSHCFVPFWVDSPDHVSHLMIGDDDSMPEGFWTKMVTRGTPGRRPMYSIELEDISVGDERLHIPPEVFRDGTVIDSGTTLTVLTPFAYFNLKQKLEKVIQLERAPEVKGFCYRGTTEDLEDLKVPYIAFHFKGLDVPAHPLKTFREIDVAVICMAIAPGKRTSVIGNHVQQDMHVGYDLVEGRLYMAPADCPSLD